MTAGDIVTVNRRCIHNVSAAQRVVYHCLIVDNSFLQDNGITADRLVFSERVQDPQAAALMEQVCAAFDNTDSEWSVAETRNTVLSFVLYMCKHHLAQTGPENPPKSDRSILEAVAYINENYALPLTLEDIAEHVQYSKYHFARRFKEATGYTVVEHLHAQRCERATELLVETQLPVSQIGCQCGFEHNSYFSKIFRRRYGISPSEYRERYAKR